MQSRMDALEESNTALKDEVAVLNGLLQVNDAKVSNLSNKVVNLTARSMSNNVIINGILGDSEKEDPACKAKVMAFLRQHMKMEVQDTEVEVAHRARGKVTAKPR